jgi:type III restriction enzyme
MYEGTKEKEAAAERWCRAVNADGRFGEGQYKMSKLTEVRESLDDIQQTLN